jgi:hypothetical protein
VKTVFRILAGLISFGSIYAVYILLKFPEPGFEKFAPTVTSIIGLVFAIFAIRGKTGINDVFGNIDLDKEIPSKTFWGGKPIWLNLSIAVLLLIFLGYLCLFVVKQ